MATTSQVAIRTPSIRAPATHGIAATVEDLTRWVQVRDGSFGDKQDAVVTRRDLLGVGVLSPADALRLGGNTGGPPLTPVPEPVIPPTPTELNTTPMQGAVVLAWNLSAYARLARFEVWRATTDDRNAAALIAAPMAQLYYDAVGVGTQVYYYWVRAVSTGEVFSPFNATAGTPGQSASAVDIPTILDGLEGQLTESHLYESLNERIDLVDGPASMPGSVAAQVQAEAASRVAGDNAEALARQTLAARVDSARNQADTSWWAPGASLPSGWIYNPQIGENSFVLSTDHTGKPATVWRCASGDSSNTGGEEPDGGWQALLPELDRNKTYRFMLPVRKNAGVFGRAYWGLYGVQLDGNPYFAYPNLQDMAVGVWYWLVGYVYPQGEYGQRGNDGAGAYASTTGAKIFEGFNYYWHATAGQYHRAYLYYGEPGAQIDFGRPLVHLVDGNEPPLDAIIRGTAGAYTAAQALVDAESTARATQYTALAQSVTTLATTVGANTTAIQTLAQTTDGLSAQYTVKIDSNGYVSGYGLASSPVDGTPTSEFLVRADRFAIASPTGPGITPAAPFYVRTTPSTVDGVTYPVGVYMTSAMIDKLAVTDAQVLSVSANKIIAGYIAAAIAMNGAKVYGAELYAGGSTTTSTDAYGNVTGFTANSPTVSIAGGVARFAVSAFQITDPTGTVVPFEVVNGVTRLKSLVVGRLDSPDGNMYIDLPNGQTMVKSGSFMKVTGAPFGTSNQFIEWYGPYNPNINTCAESTATMYLKTNGDAYYGGSLAAGVLKNGAQSTSTIATAQIEVGPFLTNGNSKTIVVSYEYNWGQQANAGTGTLTGSGGATVVLERSLNGGVNWTTLQTFSTPAAAGQVEVDGDPTVKDSISWSMSAAITTTDTSAYTTTMMLRARITSRTLMSVGGSGLTAPTIIQTLSVLSTEQ